MGLDNPLHLAILAVIVLLVFGARRLPEIGRSLGTGMREFKDSVTGADKHSLPPGPQPPTQATAQPAVSQPATVAPPEPAGTAGETPRQ
jgi:sec-independent protein translocase protein TatA